MADKLIMQNDREIKRSVQKLTEQQQVLQYLKYQQDLQKRQIQQATAAYYRNAPQSW